MNDFIAIATHAATHTWKITVDSLEGDIDFCDHNEGRSFNSFTAADCFLRNVSARVEHDCYDKVRLSVEHLPTGAEWGARIDVERGMAVSLRGHILAQCAWLLSDEAPRLLDGDMLRNARAAAGTWQGLLS